MIRRSQIDAAIDASDDPGDIATALADLLDRYGAWDWGDGSEHDPSDRAAVVESSGAWWCVYRGTEDDQAWRFVDEAGARGQLDEVQS